MPSCSQINQHQFSVNAWAAIGGHNLIGPTCFSWSEINKWSVCGFNTISTTWLLCIVPLDIICWTWFLHFCVPPHESSSHTDARREIYTQIGRSGLLPVLLSPDLTPLNFYLWEILENYCDSSLIAGWTFYILLKYSKERQYLICLLQAII